MAVQLGRLRDIGARGREEFMSDEMVQAATERRLQVAIQGLDVANHILAEDSDVTPDEYAAAFAELGKLGVIDTDLAGRLGSAAGQRNILVHMYLEVDPALVWEALEKVDDLESFAAAVERYLQKSP